MYSLIDCSFTYRLLNEIVTSIRPHVVRLPPYVSLLARDLSDSASDLRNGCLIISFAELSPVLIPSLKGPNALFLADTYQSRSGTYITLNASQLSYSYKEFMIFNVLQSGKPTEICIISVSLSSCWRPWIQGACRARVFNETVHLSLQSVPITEKFSLSSLSVSMRSVVAYSLTVFQDTSFDTSISSIKMAPFRNQYVHPRFILIYQGNLVSASLKIREIRTFPIYESPSEFCSLQ